MHLSPHFTLSELCHSQTAARRGIANRPNAAARDNLRHVAITILEPVRAHFAVPYSPTSGYRSKTLNAILGSRPTSQHILGQAVDLVLPGVPALELARWIKGNLCFDQLILEHWRPGTLNSGWVHVSAKRVDNRGRVLTMAKSGITNGLPARKKGDA